MDNVPPKTKNHSKYTRHDSYFKSGIKDTRVLIPFLKKNLPDKVLRQLDLSKLSVVSEALVTQRLDHKVVDVLFKVPCQGKETLIYILIEHQSTVYTFMPFRLTLYSFLAIDAWLRDQEKSKNKPRKLPNVVPMVYYNGEFKYGGELELANLFADPELFIQTITQPMKLVQVDDIDEELLQENPRSHVFHTAMMHAHDMSVGILLDLFKKMLHIESEDQSGVDFVMRTIRYLITSTSNIGEDDIREAVEQLTLTKEDTMTVLEQIEMRVRKEKDLVIAELEREKAKAEREKVKAEREKVKAEREKAKAEREKAKAEREKVRVAANFLRAGLDKKFVAENTGMPLGDIEAIAADL